MNTLFSDKIFYHIYPLGMFGCKRRNDFCCPAGNGFEILTGYLDKISELGINALLIGPVFESSSHGYDTVDYYYVDRRLGNNEKFVDFCRECHKRGIAVILDAVFNHTGRDFFAFKDIIQNGESSIYKNWYVNLNFSARSCFGDNFDYDGWAGCKDLVKLNVDNTDVQRHIFGAVSQWIELFDIDGLRLDAADVLSERFMDSLSAFCKSKKNNFWLMGEVVHDDYNKWAKTGRLDSVTNYQIYKSLWSALNEKNMYELSYNLKREFDVDSGIYKNITLYNFIDNHDVNRIASTLKDSTQLKLLYGLLFTIPGIPSIYYGSEYGIRGRRGEYDDFQLRPSVRPFVNNLADFAEPEINGTELEEYIGFLSKVRKSEKVIQDGWYREIAVQHQQIIFSRYDESENVIVCVNGASEEAEVLFMNNSIPTGRYKDLLTYRSVYIVNSLLLPAKSFMILKCD